METAKINNNEVTLLVDTKFYGYLAILEAATVFTKNCFVCLDGNPHDKIAVTLKPMIPDADLSTLGNEFYNCMLSIINTGLSKFEYQ